MISAIERPLFHTNYYDNWAKRSSSWVWVGARAMPTGKNLQFSLQGTKLIMGGDMKGILRVDLLKRQSALEK